MNGDLTRSTFDANDNFSAVRAQQGRVMLDADHNEQVDIQLHDTRAGRADLVGASGAPAEDAGFALTLVAGVPAVGEGRYLVEGVRVRSTATLRLDQAQPFLPGNTLPATAGAWLAYLEVWERPLTAVEEPSIREVALGGPDTTLRDQVVWQVRWLRVGDAGTSNCALAAAELDALANAFDGTLEPRFTPGSSSGPCIVSDAAEYRGLENQLYRIEVHTGNVLGDGSSSGQSATFKWSRDNAAVVAQVQGLASASPLELIVDRLGPGGSAGFDIGSTLEIRNEARTLSGQPGLLARVDDAQGDRLRVTLLGGAVLSDLQAMLSSPRLVARRWDSAGALPASTTFVGLEDGLEVRFSANGRYRTGDFWLVPARTATLPGSSKQIDWPWNGASFGARRPHGFLRRRAPLALLDRAANGTWSVRRDCRRLYPQLTSVWNLVPAGGDGQHGTGGAWLPSPVRVLLTRGSLPIKNAPVRFRIASGGGMLSSAQPTSAVPASQVDVNTDDAGIALVYWRLGPAPTPLLASTTWEPARAQTVEVTRLGPGNVAMGSPIQVVAQTADPLQLHIVGGNGQQGRPGETLEVALRVRIDDGQRPVQNAVVEFAILNTLYNGQNLDQSTGGAVHASANFVSGTVWNGGTQYQTVRTTTDSLGVAQVQWRLGTELNLTTQRVEARLVGPDGAITPQSAIFIAQLALAGEVTWRPLVPWLAALLSDANRTVQGAIDAIAQRVDDVARSTVFYQPFANLAWRSTRNGQVAQFTAAPSMHISDLASIVFRADLVPSGRNTELTHAHQGVRVYVEVPEVQGRATGLTRVVRLQGNLNRTQLGWEWTLSSLARSWLPYAPELLTRVTVVPRWLPGGLETDSAAVHEFLFTMLNPLPPVD